MSRAEELTTKLRTLSYDHERMVSMYRTATDKGANAEREMNLHKSRLAYVHSLLQVQTGLIYCLERLSKLCRRPKMHINKRQPNSSVHVFLSKVSGLHTKQKLKRKKKKSIV